jgi:hypothetical protein
MITVEEGRPPAFLVAREGKVIPMPRHASRDVADADPGIQPAMQCPQLGGQLEPADTRKPEGGLEQRAALFWLPSTFSPISVTYGGNTLAAFNSLPTKEDKAHE